MNEPQRVQKRIAQAGIASRRKAEQLIIDGQVAVNGKTLTKLGRKVTDQDIISVNGQVINSEKFEYYLLNKPAGYVSSNKSYPNQPSVIGLINSQSRLFSVGRLDQDTTGVLLLTNDGSLTQKLTHPKHRIKRIYEALVKGVPTESELADLTKPMRFDNEIFFPQSGKIIEQINPTQSLLEVTVAEGKNHEIKKILQHIGHPVIKLHRKMFAGISLGQLESGKYRTLTQKEIEKLKQ
ncbi:MAG: pseudouridine synthase [Oenococcus sp.]|uniref:pseudouridine synthase n=1 Tax=Oenococcus sp. TaxID=1979414 RepID=UPI0039EC96F6